MCTFTVAVNRKKKEGQNPEADFFKVTAWRERGETCAKYLAKGKKVAVIGPVSVSTYPRNDGTTGVSLDVTADEVEFLSSRNDNPSGQPVGQPVGQPMGNPMGQQVAQPLENLVDPQSRFWQVSMDDSLPF